MIYKHSFLLAVALATVSSAAFVACSNDDNNDGGGNNGGMIDNEKELLMFKGDKNSATKLGEDIFIGEDNVFQAENNDGYYPHAYFALTPNVKNLGDIKSVPKSGWATKSVVRKGYGYVFYNSNDYDDSFKRIFVEDVMRDDDGKIVGYNIKYQQPFYGKDIDIQLPKNELSFTADGGEEKVKFLDNEPISFSCESTAYWCRATPISSLDESFLTNAVNVSVDNSDTVGVSTATITLTTGYDKKKEIKVTRAAAEPRMRIYCGYGYVTSMDLPVSASGASQSVYIDSNIPLEDIEVENTASSWCEAKLEKNSGYYYYSCKYLLNIKSTDNDTDAKRTGAITLKYRKGETSVKLNVEQERPYVTMEKGYSEENPYIFGHSYNYEYVYFQTSLDRDDIKVTNSANWLTVSYDSYDSNRIRLSVNTNYSSSDREDVVTISNKKGNVLCKFKVKQSGE